MYLRPAQRYSEHLFLLHKASLIVSRIFSSFSPAISRFITHSSAYPLRSTLSSISSVQTINVKSIVTTSLVKMGDDQRWETVPACGDCPSYKAYTGPINKSDLDTRDYRILELPNRLQAVLVHDATADKAAACVHVAAGHLQDPVSLSYYRTCVTLISSLDA